MSEVGVICSPLRPSWAPAAATPRPNHSSPCASPAPLSVLPRAGAALFGVALSWALSCAAGAEPPRRPAELEFDARVIQGQRAEGAVYLFQRAQRPLPPLLVFERDYLGAIVTPLFGPQTAVGKEHAERVGMEGGAFSVRPAALGLAGAAQGARQAAQGAAQGVGAAQGAAQGSAPARPTTAAGAARGRSPAARPPKGAPRPPRAAKGARGGQP